ncbi:hypothetical protein E3P99_01981 [Wallemia hederae]|uniref:PUM-HD domain-containing protein n=1 Tax=Wallemia hederae TaxID=1540922 RepID=A0A4T0FP70_9BASI|nr:hypothetical protein E3P99_01981 [Wallemia hederae]
MFYDDDMNKIWRYTGTVSDREGDEQILIRTGQRRARISKRPLSSCPQRSFNGCERSLMLHVHNPSHTHSQLNPHNGKLNFREMLKPESDVNYAVLLELVQRIIVKTDQQASIFLQQKLKSLKRPNLDYLVDAVLHRALPLSTNRFGNFLIQRILDIDDISYKLRIVNSVAGQMEGIAMNSYGTHVLQKLLSTSPEHVKLLIINELLEKNVAQGMIHKNASHVWSKVLEVCVRISKGDTLTPQINWIIYSPNIMATVNAAMKGKWVNCANTDTGSLIIQTVLLKEDSGACFNEILNNITACAINKWGSTVVQYLIEKASDASLARVTTLLIYSYKQLSVDFHGARCLLAALTMGRKKDYAVGLLSDLLLNDEASIHTVKTLVDSPIGAQFLVNVLSLMSKRDHHRLLTLLRSSALALQLDW